MSEDLFQRRTRALQDALNAAGISLALITDEDSIYFFSGYHGYLYMEFGRPTVLAVPQAGPCAIVTPAMELEMAQRMSWVERILPWQDGVGREWREPLDELLGEVGEGPLGIEAAALPPVVRTHLGERDLRDISADVAALRRIKGPADIALARHAGQVAEAMMAAARATIGEGVPEYEVALATTAAGTRKAAELFEAHYDASMMSPNAHFLQTMASGSDTTMPHHRATTKRLKRGDPVFMCFCGMTNFRRFKLGFDRMFWVGELGDPLQAEVYEVALASQRAALAKVRPGVTAETVHLAYAEVIQGAGYDFPFRCGRATGFSFLESPQITQGDKTVLEPGMVLAVDGSVNCPGVFRAQVGDSLVVTNDGYELLTNYPKALDEMIVG
ncbi:MAG: Xaa-Pro peptidase family protein [Pseudomonadota bacterium]